MNISDLIAEIEKNGGKVEPIKMFCKFQNIFAKSIFDYCEQTKNRDYTFNLGTAGGPGICCAGAPAPILRWEDGIDSQDYMMRKAIYGKKPEPCSHYIKDGEVIGYKVILPRGSIDDG